MDDRLLDDKPLKELTELTDDVMIEDKFVDVELVVEIELVIELVSEDEDELTTDDNPADELTFACVDEVELPSSSLSDAPQPIR